MSATRIRMFGSLLISLVIMAAFLMPDDALAKKKKRKKKRGKKANAALVEPAEQETPEQLEAREHYSNGKALYDEQKFEEALQEFEAAYAIKSHPTVLKSIAECQVQLGDLKAGIDTLKKYVDSPEAADKESVEARIAEIENMPLKVSITSQPEGAAISVAGTEISQVTPATIELAQGEYIVTLSAEGYSPVSRSIAVKIDGTNALSIDFAAEAAAAEPAADDAIVDPFANDPTVDDYQDPAATQEAEAEDDGGLPNAFWATVAVAGVGLVSGTVFGTMALGDEKDYEENPSQAKKDAGERDAIISDVSFGVAGAAAIVGTVILVTSLKKNKEKSNAATFRVLPTVGREQLGMSAGVSF